MTLGKAGGNRPGETADPSSFYQPNDVITNDGGRDLRVRGPQRRARRARAHHQVRSHRQVHQGVRQARQRPRRVHSAARAGVRFEGPAVRRGSIEQPHPDLRPGPEPARHGWEQYSRISGLWIDARRHALCRRFRVRIGRRRRTAPGRAASASAASGTARTARSSSSFPTPTTKPPAPARPKAWRWTPQATSTGPKWDRALKKYVRK